MAMTIAESSIIAAGTVIAAGGTEAAPVAAGAPQPIGPFADYAASFAYRLTNHAGALGAPATIVFYAGVGARMYEVDRVTGTMANGDTTSGTVPCPPGFTHVTAKVSGNQTNPIQAEVYLERQVP